MDWRDYVYWFESDNFHYFFQSTVRDDLDEKIELALKIYNRGIPKPYTLTMIDEECRVFTHVTPDQVIDYIRHFNCTYQQHVSDKYKSLVVFVVHPWHHVKQNHH